MYVAVFAAMCILTLLASQAPLVFDEKLAISKQLLQRALDANIP